jgi:predicted lipoprotein with Yx(FWY)xxD motif
MRRSYLIVGALALIGAVVIAGCGGGSSSSSTTTESEPAAETGTTKEAAAKPAEEAAAEPEGEATPISLGEAAGVGKVLVDSEGMTLYYFQKDQNDSGRSKCEGACAEAWPPLTTEGEPEAMAGVKASMLGTIKRNDGTTQVTYAGWPLYTFVEDKKPGEDNGTDSKAFGASWYPLHSNGKKGGH